MGLTGGMVKSAFTRSRVSANTSSNESSARNYIVEKKRWSSVRSYLCGDEFNSVLAEDDSTSERCSEVTVTQLISEDIVQIQAESQAKKETALQEKPNSISKLFHEDDAAIIIQSAFREFLARQRSNKIGPTMGEKNVLVVAITSPSKDSIATSIEVQPGNSVSEDVLSESTQEERPTVSNRMRKKSTYRVMKPKEDWDDSTLSSNVSKMRIQSRLEAMTRRERALAYAFSQQLRICSKKRSNKPEDTESNMEWSWLERWMATRAPDTSSTGNLTTEKLQPIFKNEGFMVNKKLHEVGIAGEEKESCGSNEVPIQFDTSSITSTGQKYKPSKNNRPRSTMSRRKTVPSHQCPKDYDKVINKDTAKETTKKHKQNILEGLKEMNSKDA